MCEPRRMICLSVLSYFYLPYFVNTIQTSIHISVFVSQVRVKGVGAYNPGCKDAESAGTTHLAARASCWCVKGNGDSQAASFLGSSRLRILEMLKDLCEGGDDVLGELAPLSEPRAGAGLVLDTSGEPDTLSPSARLPTAEEGERLPRGEGDLLWAREGLPRVMTLATS